MGDCFALTIRTVGNGDCHRSVLTFGSNTNEHKREELFSMPVYMVERDLPGIQMDQLAAAQKAAIETSNKFTSE
jgi:hypothetical protein